MSSWYVWGATGLYPNAGRPFYYVTGPPFERAALALGGGRLVLQMGPKPSLWGRDERPPSMSAPEKK